MNFVGGLPSLLVALFVLTFLTHWFLIMMTNSVHSTKNSLFTFLESEVRDHRMQLFKSCICIQK